MKKNLLLNTLFLSLLFAFVFFFSYKALWLGDDTYYGYHCETMENLSSLQDVFSSQFWHYFNINGRFVAHTLVQISIAFWGQTVFSLLNAVVYILLIVGLFRLTKQSLLNTRLLLLSSLLVIVCFQTKFVPSCQIGYIWMACMVVWMLHLFLNKLDLPKWHLVWIVPFAFITGWGQEGINVGVGFAMFIYICKNFKKISLVQWCVFIAFAMGALLLVVAPGSHKRLADSKATGFSVESVVLSVYNFFYFSRAFYYVIALLILNLLYKVLNIKDYILKSQLLYFVSAVVVLYLLSLYIGLGTNRMLFGAELFLIIALMTLYQSFHKYLTHAFIIVSLAQVVYISYRNADFLQQETKIYAAIEQQFIQNKGVIKYDISNKYVNTYQTDPSDGFSGWAKKMIERVNEKKCGVYYKLCFLPSQSPKVNTVVLPAKGQYFALISKDDKVKNIAIKRCWNIWGIKISKADLYMNLDSPIWENDSLKAIQFFVPVDLPFDHFGEATITYKE